MRPPWEGVIRAASTPLVLRTHDVTELEFHFVVTGCSGDDTTRGPSSAAVSAGSQSAADTLVKTGLQQLEQGDDAKARSTFENVLKLDPDNVYAHFNLGLLAQDAGKD